VDIQQEVRTFIANDLGRDVQRVTDAESLLEGGILDSLGVLSLVGFIEKHYGITVSEDEMMPENFDSIDAIAAFVAGRRSSRA
jgi:acyl carrier protein